MHRRRWRWLVAAGLCPLLAGCTLSRPHYTSPDVSVGEPAFVRTLEAHTDSPLVRGNSAQILLNGDEIFPSMLAASRQAKTTITFANFVYEKGDIARDMAETLAERCRAGVGVNVLLDAVGSNGMPKKYRQLMERAGCHVASYHSINPFAIKRINHRNHRRVLVVDGRIGFTGGTGVGEKWTGDGRTKGYWRQTDVRVEGPIVSHLQAAFAENWRDATGFMLGGRPLLSGDRAARDADRPGDQELAGQRCRCGLHALPARDRCLALVDPAHQSVLRAGRGVDRRGGASGEAGSGCVDHDGGRRRHDP